MRDILAAVAAAFLLFVAIDPDSSVWHDPKRLGPYYAKLLVLCMNGHGFSAAGLVVMCYPTPIAASLVHKHKVR